MRTVLIVDDDPVAVRLLERSLTDAGYKVVSAFNGREALDVMRDEAPSLVVTDWDMPEMDGLELCRRIRGFEGFGVVYTIVLTSHTDEDRIVEAFEAGTDDYLTKPFDRRELLARLRAGERVIDLEHDLAKQKREIFRYNANLTIANQKLARANDQLSRIAQTDELTGLANRRAAMKILGEQWRVAEEDEEPLACIMLDLDHFKSFNDTFGHSVGDRILAETAETLQSSVRHTEQVFRIGGEEFLVLCPHATAEMAAVAAERLRKAVETLTVSPAGHDLRVTTSLGVAERTPQMERADDLLKNADDALYDAKRAGRNCVRVAAASAEPVAMPARRDDRASA